MQNVLGEGDFDHYQGVWRMQSLPNCAPNGGDASRLTYAVEIKPKGILPVKLIEGRIASDLKANMAAIRTFVEAAEKKKVRHAVVTPDEVATAVSMEEISIGVEKQQVEVPVLHRVKTKRSILRKITNYLIGNWEDDSIALVESEEAGMVESSGHLLTLSPLVDSRASSSSSAMRLAGSSKATVVLLEENIRLKERVAYLEGEMAKANTVLRKIEILSKLD